MPELPEVETTKQGIIPYVVGETITAVAVRQPQLRWPIPEVVQQLTDANVLAVTRRAKFILIATNKGQVLLHLGMTGALRILPQATAPEKHDHVDFLLSSGMLLRYTDPRRFGAILWAATGEQHKMLAHLGPEPLGEEFSGEYLHAIAAGRRQAVKPFIMDNKVVVGVGNIYAQEALFKAGIHPSRAAGRVSLARYQTLYNAIVEVLNAALAAGGTTLKDFTKADGQPGYFQQELAVYGRAGKPCVQCAAPLKKAVHGQRSTVYCGRCQR